MMKQYKHSLTAAIRQTGESTTWTTRFGVESTSGTYVSSALDLCVRDEAWTNPSA